MDSVSPLAGVLMAVAEGVLLQVAPFGDEQVDRIPDFGAAPLAPPSVGGGSKAAATAAAQFVVGQPRDVDLAVEHVAQRLQVVRVFGEPLAERDADLVGEVAGLSPPATRASR